MNSVSVIAVERAVGLVPRPTNELDPTRPMLESVRLFAHGSDWNGQLNGAFDCAHGVVAKTVPLMKPLKPMHVDGRRADQGSAVSATLAHLALFFRAARLAEYLLARLAFSRASPFFTTGQLKDRAVAMGAVIGGRAVEVAIFIHDQTASRISSVTAACEGIKHSQFAVGSQLVDGSTAVSIAALARALKGGAIEIALGIADHTSIRSKPVCPAGKAVEHGLGSLLR